MSQMEIPKECVLITALRAWAHVTTVCLWNVEVFAYFHYQKHNGALKPKFRYDC